MTYPPTMLLPSVAVYVDGQWVADGRNPYSTDPQVLTGLVVRWGRSTVVDQPQASTCSLTLLDTQGGGRFLDSIQLGMRLDVVADALLSDTPSPGEGVVVIDETFTSGPGNAYVGGVATIAASGGVLLVTSAGNQSVSVVVPPGAREPVGGNPAAWDGIPRAAQGQTWTASADVKLPAPFAGYSGWAVQVYPVTYDSPWDTATALAELGTRADLGNGWVRVSGEFVPPTGAWLGVQVRLWPIGPAWDELDPTTWDQLPGATGVRTNLATNPGYEAGGSSILTGSGSTYLQTADTTAPISGSRSSLFTRADPNPSSTIAQVLCTGTTAKLPVTPGQPVTGGLSIKTDVANAQVLTRWYWYDAGNVLTAGPITYRYTKMNAGQVYRCVETATPPAGTVTAYFVVQVQTASGNSVTGQRVWADMLTLEYGTTDGSYFDGSTPDTPAVRYDWTGSPNASTSTATGLGVAVTWDELGRMAIDNVSLKAPASGTLRSGMVFSGRITDMVAQFDDTAGGTLVEVTGADQRAELGNRDVGDQPWLEETLGSRFSRIVTASGQPIESRVSPTAAAMMVSWRDIDRQPAMTLLSELATSADGVLWAATHPTTGPYLLLESLSDRPPQFVLVKGADGVIRISTADPSATGALTIDACDILLEPIRWRHDVQDMATRVAVTWREQTLDDKGQPAPTDRTITQVNPLLEADIGVHRVAVGTQLSRQADAQLVSDAVLARTSNTQWRVSGLDWRADTTDQLDADALGRMMTLLDGTTRNGLPILLTNVPEWSPIPQDAGVALYLEGGVYTSTDGGWDLSLITSSARAQGGADVAWDDQPADWTWDQYDPAVTWNALHGVGIS